MDCDLFSMYLGYTIRDPAGASYNHSSDFVYVCPALFQGNANLWWLKRLYKVKLKVSG